MRHPKYSLSSSSGQWSVLSSLLVALVATLGLGLTAVYLLSKTSLGVVNEELFAVFPIEVEKITTEIISDNPLIVDYSAVTSATLSASMQSGQMFVLVVALLIAFLPAILWLVAHISTKKPIALFVTLLGLGTAIAATTWARVDDLDDEAYAWATKIETLSETGILGIPLFDGRYGESSVGTLHFLVSAAMMLLLPVTVEQALISTLIFPALCSSALLCTALYRKGYTLPWSALISGAVFLSPPIVLTSSKGFDTALILALLVTWLAGESLLGQPRRAWLRVSIATLAPLIRLEFAAFSLLLLGADLLDARERRGNKDVKALIRSAAARWSPAVAVALAWVSYKQAVFSEVVPAMASYKSPWFDVGAFESGARYLVSSVGEPFFLGLLFLLSLVSVRLLARPKFRRRLVTWVRLNFAIVLPVGISSLLGIFTAVSSGGDYFGPSYARYFFPYAVATALALLLWAPWTKNVKSWARPSIASLVVLSLLFSLNQPSQHREQMADFTSISPGRVSCDRAGLMAVERVLESRGTERPSVVATPEINGAAYFFDAELVDMISLVDTDALKVLAPQKPGSTFDKYQVTLTKSQIEATDLVWLWPSSYCGLSAGELDVFLEDGQSNMRSFLVNPDALYRFPQVGIAIESGLSPVMAGFQYQDGGSTHYGLLRFLARGMDSSLPTVQ